MVDIQSHKEKFIVGYDNAAENDGVMPRGTLRSHFSLCSRILLHSYESSIKPIFLLHVFTSRGPRIAAPITFCCIGLSQFSPVSKHNNAWRRSKNSFLESHIKVSYKITVKTCKSIRFMLAKRKATSLQKYMYTWS